MTELEKANELTLRIIQSFGSKVGLKSRFSGFSASLNLDSWDGVNPEL